LFSPPWDGEHTRLLTCSWDFEVEGVTSIVPQAWNSSFDTGTRSRGPGPDTASESALHIDVGGFAAPHACLSCGFATPLSPRVLTAGPHSPSSADATIVAFVDIYIATHAHAEGPVSPISPRSSASVSRVSRMCWQSAYNPRTLARQPRAAILSVKLGQKYQAPTRSCRPYLPSRAAHQSSRSTLRPGQKALTMHAAKGTSLSAKTALAGWPSM
jgi:hypothetical protein